MLPVEPKFLGDGSLPVRKHEKAFINGIEITYFINFPKINEVHSTDVPLMKLMQTGFDMK